MIQIKNRWTGKLILEIETLTDADLTMANLTMANLTDADLTMANLTMANLTNANLTDANLHGANLHGANLHGANLRGANLTKANLTKANLRGANLTKANLTKANLDFASWPLWCGSLSPIIDEPIKCQLLYHIISVIGTADFTPDQITRANQFHRVTSGECQPLPTTNPTP